MKTLEKKQLTHILQFSNEDIISRFIDMYQIEIDEVKDIFNETLKFLYISQIPGVFIPDDLLIIDEMWHNMILFTPQYHKFSKEYFNTAYLHHVPASKKEKEEHQNSMRNKDVQQIYFLT